MADDAVFMRGEALILCHDINGNETHRDEITNIVVRAGRKDILRHLINSGSPINTGFVYLGYGDSSTAAAVTDTALVNELNDPATRKTCTDTSGGSLDDTDIVQETSGSFDQKVVYQAVYSTSEGNGNNFREYAIFSSATIGAGTMFNRFVASSSVAKNNTISLTVQLTVRI